MHFRNLHADELKGSVDIPGLNDWLVQTGATDAAVLILAPPGTGKAAAVGRIADRLGRDVLMCNLMELFENHDAQHQLENLLRLCEAQKNSVMYLDKLDAALAKWKKLHEGDDSLAKTLCSWLRQSKEKLVNDECLLVFTGRDQSAVPQELISCFNKALIA
ncbi:MAG: AAA family ATPase [Armatimonadota bacterium]